MKVTIVPGQPAKEVLVRQQESLHPSIEPGHRKIVTNEYQVTPAGEDRIILDCSRVEAQLLRDYLGYSSTEEKSKRQGMVRQMNSAFSMQGIVFNGEYMFDAPGGICVK